MSFLQSFKNLFRKKQEEVKLPMLLLYCGGFANTDSFYAFRKDYGVANKSSDDGFTGGLAGTAELMLGGLVEDKESFLRNLSLQLDLSYDFLSKLARICAYVNWNIEPESLLTDGFKVKSAGLGIQMPFFFDQHAAKTTKDDIIEDQIAFVNTTKSNYSTLLGDHLATLLTIGKLPTAFSKDNATDNSSTLTGDDKGDASKKVAADVLKKELAKHLLTNATLCPKGADLAALDEDGFKSVRDAAKVTQGLKLSDFDGITFAPKGYDFDNAEHKATGVELTKDNNAKFQAYYKLLASQAAAANKLTDQLDKAKTTNTDDKKPSLSTLISDSTYRSQFDSYCDTLDGRLNHNRGLTSDSWALFLLSFASVHVSFANVMSGHLVTLDVRNVGASLTAQVGYKAYALQQS